MSSLALPSFVEAFVTREDWGGGPVKAQALPAEWFDQWYLHHTVGAMKDYDRDGFLNGDLDDVRRFMKNLQLSRPDLGSEVPYNVVVFPGTTDATCILAVGRGPHVKGAHTAGQNSHVQAWAIAGNTDVDVEISPGMVAGMRWIAYLWTVRPDRVLRTKGHREAPPYYDSRGVNLSATGCPGNRGIEVVHEELQGPFLPPVKSELLPTVRSQNMEYVTRSNGRRVCYDLDEQGQLMAIWEKTPGSGVMDSGWHVVIPGRFRSMSKPLQNDARTMERIDLVNHSALGDFAGIRIAAWQPTFEGTWTTAVADQLDLYLAGLK